MAAVQFLHGLPVHWSSVRQYVMRSRTAVDVKFVGYSTSCKFGIFVLRNVFDVSTRKFRSCLCRVSFMLVLSRQWPR